MGSSSSSSMMLQIQRSKVGVSTIQIQIDSIQYRFIKIRNCQLLTVRILFTIYLLFNKPK
ncbi:hypothetical protein HanPSC8_Chr15g0648931 [Helianthus annuus]|nr:hypothetical protein HanPSC8_Chr15g0648931 [Helianthus annuus]